MERIFILLMAGIHFLPLYAKLPTPDFTMPETEMKNAENQIEKAIKTQDNRMLIDGMIRLSLAKTRITSDNLPQSIIHLDSIATSTTDTSACTRDGTVAAIVVAAVLHFQKIPGTVAA